MPPGAIVLKPEPSAWSVTGETATRTGLTGALLADDTMASASGHCVAPPRADPADPVVDMADEGAGEGFTNPLEPQAEMSNEPGVYSSTPVNG